MHRRPWLRFVVLSALAAGPAMPAAAQGLSAFDSVDRALAQVETFMREVEKDPGQEEADPAAACARSFRAEDFYSRIGAGTLSAHEKTVLASMQAPITDYAIEKAYMIKDLRFCDHLAKVPLETRREGREKTAADQCRAHAGEMLFARAVRENSSDFVATCQQALKGDRMPAERTGPLCDIIRKNLADPARLCSELSAAGVKDDPAKCRCTFGSMRGKREFCDPRAADASRSVVYAQAALAIAAKDLGRCGTSQRCRVLAGDAGVLTTRERSLALAACADRSPLPVKPPAGAKALAARFQARAKDIMALLDSIDKSLLSLDAGLPAASQPDVDRRALAALRLRERAIKAQGTAPAKK